MEETKHEYVDLVADHILTNAIRPQINSFLEGFNELVPRELISIFNDKELELLISGLPEIDCKLACLISFVKLSIIMKLLNDFDVFVVADLKANTEYTGYTAASNVVQWFWEVVEGFSKEDMARLLQFVTGTSKVIHLKLDCLNFHISLICYLLSCSTAVGIYCRHIVECDISTDVGCDFST